MPLNKGPKPNQSISSNIALEINFLLTTKEKVSGNTSLVSMEGCALSQSGVSEKNAYSKYQATSKQNSRRLDIINLLYKLLTHASALFQIRFRYFYNTLLESL